MVSYLTKFAICTVLVVLSVLLTKGLSYSLPAVKPVGKRTLSTNSSCSLVTECRPCSSYEKKYLKQCLSTGNIQEVTCDKTGTRILQSCPFASKAEIKRFWVFEACMICLALFFNIVVWFRRKSLDAFKYQRLKRQISDSV